MMLLWWATSLNDMILAGLYESSSLFNFLNFDIDIVIRYINNRVYINPRKVIRLAKSLLNLAEEQNDPFIKYLMHRALGKAYFELDLYATALAQIKESMKILEKIKTDVIYSASLESFQEEFAKLNAIAGFLAYRLRDWNAAKKYIENALDYLKSMILKKPNERSIKTLLGELYSIYGDVLAFLAKPESTNAYEQAHELLKEQPSMLLIINGVKLAAHLIARGFRNEALTLLKEIVENPFNLFKHADDGILRSVLLAINLNISRFLSEMRLRSYEQALNFVISTEGLKGITFAFRTWYKIADGIRLMYELNRGILYASPKQVLTLEQMRRRKIRAYQNRYEIYVPWRALKYANLEKVVDILSPVFEEIYLLAFSKENENSYSVFLISLKPKGVYIQSAFKVDANTIANVSKNMNDFSILRRLIGTEILEKLYELNEKSLLILSLDDVLHEIPWENIPIDGDYPYIGLKVPIVRIPTIYAAYLWLMTRGGSSTFSIIGERRIDEYKMVKKSLKRRGYRVIDEYEFIYYLDENARVKGFHFCSNLLESVIDAQVLPISRLIIRPDDEMLLCMHADFAFLNAHNTTSIFLDEFGEHSLPICLLSAGVQTVVSVIGFPSEKEMFEFAYEFYKPRRLRAYERLLHAKRELYKKGSDAFKYYVMYGNPLVLL